MGTVVKLIAGAASCVVRAALVILHVFASSLIQAAASLWRGAQADWRHLAARSKDDPDSTF